MEATYEWIVANPSAAAFIGFPPLLLAANSWFIRLIGASQIAASLIMLAAKTV